MPATPGDDIVESSVAVPELKVDVVEYQHFRFAISVDPYVPAVEIVSPFRVTGLLVTTRFMVWSNTPGLPCPIFIAVGLVFVIAILGSAMTLNVVEVAAVRASPEVRVAVRVAPIPVDARVTPDTVIELFPEAIVPATVPPIAPALPLVERLKAVADDTFAIAPVPSCD